jgi:hypothetical protein
MVVAADMVVAAATAATMDMRDAELTAARDMAMPAEHAVIAAGLAVGLAVTAAGLVDIAAGLAVGLAVTAAGLVDIAAGLAADSAAVATADLAAVVVATLVVAAATAVADTGNI